MAKKVIVQNEAQCMKCGDIIVSKHVHDFVECGCGAIYVDGGMEYLKRGFETDAFIDRSLKMDADVVHLCMDAVEDSINDSKNELGIALAVIRTLRNSGMLRNNRSQTNRFIVGSKKYIINEVVEKGREV